MSKLFNKASPPGCVQEFYYLRQSGVRQGGGPSWHPPHSCRLGARRSIRRAAKIADGKFVRR